MIDHVGILYVMGDENLIRYIEAPTYYEIEKEKEATEALGDVLETLFKEGASDEEFLGAYGEFLEKSSELLEKEKSPQYTQEKLSKQQLLESKIQIWKQQIENEVKNNIKKSIENLFMKLKGDTPINKKDIYNFVNESLIINPKYPYWMFPLQKELVILGASAKLLSELTENFVDFHDGIKIYSNLKNKEEILKIFYECLKDIETYPNMKSVIGENWYNYFVENSEIYSPYKYNLKEYTMKHFITPLKKWYNKEDVDISQWEKEGYGYVINNGKYISIHSDLYDSDIMNSSRKLFFNVFYKGKDYQNEKCKKIMNLTIKADSLVNEYQLKY